MVFLTIEYVNKAEIPYLVFTRYDPGGVFFWPPYNRSNVLVSGCPSLLIPTS